MADINIERKGRSAWPWLLALLLVLVIAAGAWWFLGRKGEYQGAAVSPDTTSPAAVAPAYDSATAPPYPAVPANEAVPPADTMTR